jgi:translation initiation factor 2 beta subunit (eIF-2beta)/eIF-5
MPSHMKHSMSLIYFNQANQAVFRNGEIMLPEKLKKKYTLLLNEGEDYVHYYTLCCRCDSMHLNRQCRTIF